MYRIRTSLACLLLAIMSCGIASAAPKKPKSVMHIITIQWKPETPPAKIEAAIKAAESIKYPGVKNIWTRPIKMQLPEGFQHIIVMEFESEESLKKYADSPAQKEWYEVYMPIRAESRTHDVTN